MRRYGSSRWTQLGSSAMPRTEGFRSREHLGARTHSALAKPSILLRLALALLLRSLLDVASPAFLIGSEVLKATRGCESRGCRRRPGVSPIIRPGLGWLQPVQQSDHGDPEHVVRLEVNQNLGQVPGALALVELPDEIGSGRGVGQEHLQEITACADRERLESGKPCLLVHPSHPTDIVPP
jgi:hypothetical protein